MFYWLPGSLALERGRGGRKKSGGGRWGKLASQIHSRGASFSSFRTLKIYVVSSIYFLSFPFVLEKKTLKRQQFLFKQRLIKGLSYLQKVRMADCLLSHQLSDLSSFRTSSLKIRIKMLFFPSWVKSWFLKTLTLAPAQGTGMGTGLTRERG